MRIARFSALMFCALGAIPVLVACGGSGDTPSGTRSALHITVAPLSLPGVGVACYDVGVFTASGTVWTKGDPDLTFLGADEHAPPDATFPATTPNDSATICSDQFNAGAATDIAYVGSCDASPAADVDGDATNGTQNWVVLLLDGLYNFNKTKEIGSWTDPCSEGCALEVTCHENADALAEFNLTVMREANQGFFDVAVNFSDIFCSAKFDTCYANATATVSDDDPIKLLAGGDTVRDWTGVFGFACTAGPDSNTTLAYGDVAVNCDGGVSFDIDPTLPEGTNHVATSGASTLHYGVFRGNEQLDCDDATTTTTESCTKRFWNLAFDLADLGALADCNLTLSATATDGNETFASGLPTGVGVSYPYIDVAASLGSSCQHNALNDGGAVMTAYHGNIDGMADPVPVCDVFDGTTVSNACVSACPCWTAADVLGWTQAVAGGGTVQGAVSDALNYVVFDNSAVGAVGLGSNRLCQRLDGSQVTDISPQELATCMADVDAVLGHPCSGDAACSGIEPVCIYAGPGANEGCIGCLIDEQCVSEECNANGACMCTSNAQCPGGTCDPATDTCTCGIAWTETTPLPTARVYFGVAAANDHLYVSGGATDSGYLDDIEVAPINADGTLSAFTATTPLPVAMHGHQSVIHNGFFYVIGGSASDQLPRTTVYVAPINLDGTLGSFTSLAALETARYYHTDVVVNDRLYAIGGYPGTTSVEVASINSDGTLGAWAQTTALPVASWTHTSEVAGGYLYVLGGDAGPRSEIYAAPINTDGTLGAWVQVGNLATTLSHMGSLIYDGSLFTIGGWDGSVVTDAVNLAPINADHTIGSFRTERYLPFATARHAQAVVQYGNYAYVLGGATQIQSGVIADVQFLDLAATCP